MSNREVIRAWKDEEYRLSLDEAKRAALPEHPAGLVELTDIELKGAAGGYITLLCSLNCTLHPVGCGGQTNSHIWC